MKKKYIIVGSNNFWYTTTEPVSFFEGLPKEIEKVKEGIERGDYDHSEKPEKLFALEVTGQTQEFDV